MKHVLTMKQRMCILVLIPLLMIFLPGITEFQTNSGKTSPAKAVETPKEISNNAITDEVTSEEITGNSYNNENIQDYKTFLRQRQKEQIKNKDFYIVTATELNIREGATTKSKIVGVYKKDDVVQVIEQQSEWYKTTDGFIHSGYLKPMDDVSGGNITIAKPIIKSQQAAFSRGGQLSSFNTSVTAKTNATIAQIKHIVEGSALDGIEEAVYNVEQEYGINAFFIIAVAKLESASGTSQIARNKNNLFGLNATGRNGAEVYRNALSFKSKGDCIYAFGEIIKNNYVNKGLDTPRKINPVYCPPNSEWSSLVTSIMRELYLKIN